MSSAPPGFLCNHEATVTAEAPGNVTVDVPIHGARDWCIAMKRTSGSGAVTAFTLQRFPLHKPSAEGAVGGAVSASLGTVDGSTNGHVLGQGEPCAWARLTLTFDNPAVIALAAGGL